VVKEFLREAASQEILKNQCDPLLMLLRPERRSTACGEIPTSEPVGHRLDRFGRFCTPHPLVQSPTRRGNFRGSLHTRVGPSPRRTDDSIVYLRACTNMKKSIPCPSIILSQHFYISFPPFASFSTTKLPTPLRLKCG